MDRLGIARRLDRWVVEVGNNAAHEENVAAKIGPYFIQVFEVWQILGVWSIQFMDSAVTRTTPRY